MPISLKAAEDDDGRRLDRVLRKALPRLPLSALHRLLRKGEILVDGVKSNGERRVRAGETIEINSRAISGGASCPNNESSALLTGVKSGALKPDARVKGPRGGAETQDNQKAPARDAGNIKKTAPPLDILFEDEGLLIINKEPGLAVHGKDSLEDMVLFYLKDKLAPSLSFRPGPLHRLDRPTSGIIVFSTNLEGARYFSELLRKGLVRKRYLAITDGTIEKNETWEDLLVRDRAAQKTFSSISSASSGENASAKAAVSVVSPLAAREGRSLVAVEIKTGRTHQIRSQASLRGHPLSGDKKYGGLPLNEPPPYNRAGSGFFLHAYTLEFRSSNGKILRVKAPPPKRFSRAVIDLFGSGMLKSISGVWFNTPSDL